MINQDRLRHIPMKFKVGDTVLYCVWGFCEVGLIHDECGGLTLVHIYGGGKNLRTVMKKDLETIAYEV